MTRPILADAFAHHVWATQRLIDTCLELTPEQLATFEPVAIQAVTGAGAPS